MFDGAQQHAFPCIFMDERWLLPEMKGSGAAKPGPSDLV
jgi:hypothetical protein